MADPSLEDNIFELLHQAGTLEASDQDSVEAATKYYEAIYLMRRFLQRLPQTQEEQPKRKLFEEQIKVYESKAQNLVMKSTQEDNQGTNIPIVPATPINGDSQQGQHGIFLDASLPSQNHQRQQQEAFSGGNKDAIAKIHRLVNQANTKLVHALDLDEQEESTNAIQSYMETTEIYLQALALATASEKENRHVASVVPDIKKRVESTLDRIEQLKNPSPPKTQKQPRQAQKSDPSLLTPEEIEVLKQSSTTVSGLFLPWSDVDAQVLNKEAIRATQQGSLATVARFTDPCGPLKLSDKQTPIFYKWARPGEIVRIRQQSGLTRRQQKPILIHSISPYSVKQQFVTDCSFIASLCVTAAFERRFRKRLITSSIYPQSGPLEEPMYNPVGKYMVKLWLNGVARSVEIDDKLPIDKYGNVLCSHTTGKSSQYLELWVCLIEKAYMKLCGGYDFPGSNSGVDLFSLTGWIPERVYFNKNEKQVRDFEILPERAWDRISSASSFGDCLITVSSHLNLSDSNAEKLGLVMGHAYAVLSVIETRSGVRLLQLKNPWAQKGWKGRFSCQDKVGWQDQKFRAEVGYDPDKANHYDDGIFWICWEDILNYFQNFHLSWNPFLFRHRMTTHGLWPKEQGPYDDTFNIGDNPQYILTLSDEAIQSQAALWVLISRHVSKQEQEGGQASEYLTVHINRNRGNKETVFYPNGNCVVTSAYTNNPHVLVRYDASDEADRHLSLVLSQYQKSSDLRYTLSVFSTAGFLFSRPRSELPQCVKIAGQLNAEGGPLGSRMVMNNPMIALSVPNDKTLLELQLTTAKTTTLNVVVLPVEKAGHRLDKATGHAVIDSGKYRLGFVVTERTQLKQGAYVMMVSCYTTKQEGPFQIKCSSSKPVQLRLIQ